GHLRRDLYPDMEVEVEVLDVTDEEARVLLLSIDPLATLAETQDQIHQRLLAITPAASEELAAAWQATVEGSLRALGAPPPAAAACPAQYLIWLGRLGAEGLECKALLS